jgi:hypothetical protein
LLVLAAGIWLRVQRQQQRAPDQVAEKDRQDNGVAVVPDKARDELTSQPFMTMPADVPSKKRTSARRRSIRPTSPHNELSPAEVAEATAAKDQLMLALRVASAKLNFAQRKMQGLPASNNTRYQHKVG